ncbi:hypothetical protein TNCV_4462541 [Trichonephila clavipes]|nr:hypothetical protein TNCV_4462541 [Trichonephila clavipes]
MNTTLAWELNTGGLELNTDHLTKLLLMNLSAQDLLITLDDLELALVQTALDDTPGIDYSFYHDHATFHTRLLEPENGEIEIKRSFYKSILRNKVRFEWAATSHSDNSSNILAFHLLWQGLIGFSN